MRGLCIVKTPLIFEINGLHCERGVKDGIAAPCYSWFVMDMIGPILAA
jgi:hypothetical protein